MSRPDRFSWWWAAVLMMAMGPVLTACEEVLTPPNANEPPNTTLANIPQGQKLAMSEVSTKDSSIPVVVETPVEETKPETAKTAQTARTAKTAPAEQVVARAPTFKEVEGLLTKYTCIACHSATAKQVGPPYAEVAKRGYTNEQMVELMYSPQPANWPDYPAPMPPMAHVPKADALKIAAYINSLAK